MEEKRAAEIIRVLADGINPITGEILEAESCFNEPDVVRALYTAAEVLEKSRKRNMPENAGKPWSVEDDEKLREMFYNGTLKKDMCKYFGRTSGSISARLVRMGLIKSRYEF